MIEDTEYDTKGALTKLLNYLISVSNVLVVAHDVLLLVRIETVIVLVGDLAVRSTTWEVVVTSIFHTLLDVEEVDHIVLKNLSLLVIP